jgi:hypothetical protein
MRVGNLESLILFLSGLARAPVF